MTKRKKDDDDMRYCTMADCIAGLPIEVPSGRVLAHNHIWHHAEMPSGLNGFRFWTSPKGKQPKHFVPCPCGWAGLPHYAARDYVKASGGRCMSDEEFEKLNGYTIEEAIVSTLEDEEDGPA